MFAHSFSRVSIVTSLWTVGLLSQFAPGAEIELKNSVGMTLRLMSAGSFEMGEADPARGFDKDHVDFNPDNDERPAHPVVLTRPYYLATTEVALGQFRKFVAATGYKTTAEQSQRGALGWDPKSPVKEQSFIGTFRDGSDFNWKQPGFEQSEDHPVVCVSYTDAIAFCDWLSQQEKTQYRLPTEAEWEYAARAGTATFFSFGSVYRGQIHRFANIGNVELEKAFPDRVRRQWLVDIDRDAADGHVFTAPVGSYPANPWGLFDLHGNVWEWCQDRYLDTTYVPYERKGHQEVRPRAVDPLNDQAWLKDGDWRVIRGGSWFNAPVQCRSAVRGYFEASDGACYLGFRVARAAPAQEVAAARDRFDRGEAAREKLSGLIGGLKEVREGRLHLRLRIEHLTDEFFRLLVDLAEPLDVYLDAEGKLQPEQIARLMQAGQLKGLQLIGVGPEVSDADFAPLAALSDLEVLQVTGQPKLTDALLAHLKRMTRLESLQLDGEAISDTGLQSMAPQPRLKSLYLNGTAIAGTALEHFSTSPLERFSCSHLTDEGATQLGRFLGLREVSLSGSSLTGNGCAELARLHRLQRLDLGNCREISDAGFAPLGQIAGLASLSLQQTQAGDQAVTALARLNYLRDLRLGSTHLSDKGVQQLCNMIALESFTLHEEATELTDAALADLWQLTNLQNLELACPGITGSGLASLRELPKLDSLTLSGPDTTDAAMINAGRSRSVQRLSIGNGRSGGSAGVTDAGLVALAIAKNLKQVDLIRRMSAITDAAIEKLRAQRPTLTLNVR